MLQIEYACVYSSLVILLNDGHDEDVIALGA